MTPGLNLSTDISHNSCPYCGELIELIIDHSIEQQEYVEDCSVCCQPIVLSMSVNTESEIMIRLRRENE